MTQSDTSAKIKLGAEIAGIVSAVIALTALAVNLSRINSAVSDEQVRDWQEVVVYSIVEQAGLEGLTFDEVHDAYLKKERLQEDFNVPKSEIQEAALTRILLQLIAKRAIVVSLEDKYKLFREPPMWGSPYAANIAAMQPKSDAVIAYVAQNDKQYTVEEIRRTLADSLSLTNSQFDRIMAELLSLGMLVIQPDGKVSMGFDAPPNFPAGAAPPSARPSAADGEENGTGSF